MIWVTYVIASAALIWAVGLNERVRRLENPKAQTADAIGFTAERAPDEDDE